LKKKDPLNALSGSRAAQQRSAGGPSEHEEGEEVDREDPEREAQQRLRE